MRFVATLLLWLLATAALAVAVPANWAQRNVIDSSGYSALAASAAKDPLVRQAMSDELTAQLVTLAAGSGYDVNENLLGGAVRAYTSGSAFPGQFALANQLVHRWLVTDTVTQSDDSGRWEVDLSPMLSDNSFQQTLADFGIKAPSSLTIPLTENVSASVRPGQLRDVAKWGPWASVGAAVLAGVLALLTLASARQRGKAIVALGVSGLIVGAAGWAAIEVGRRYVDSVLDTTTGEARKLAAAMVEHAIGSLHLWLNLTLAAGGVLVVLGIVASMVGGLRRS